MQRTTRQGSDSGSSRVDAAQASEDRFFAALLTGDVGQLDDVLAPDFAIVDVITGALAQRGSFLDAFREGHLSFGSVDLVERYTRIHSDVAIIVGRTRIAGAYRGTGFTTSSRYTHVLVLVDGQWRLEAAQGTSIIDA